MEGIWLDHLRVAFDEAGEPLGIHLVPFALDWTLAFKQHDASSQGNGFRVLGEAAAL